MKPKFAARIASLTPEQRALLDQRLQTLVDKQTPTTGRTIPTRTKPNYNRLSVDQERLWLIHQFDKDDPAYNIFFVYQARGVLDLAVFERTINTLVARHESLRTTFTLQDNQPVQVIHPAMLIDVPLRTFDDLPESERAAAVLEAANAEIRVPFDLERGPLLRVTVLQQATDEYRLLFVVHHTVWDRWSVSLFQSEMIELYTAFITGREPKLGQQLIQYADYAEWQREWVRTEVMTKQLPYWRQQLAGASFVLDLPTDRPRPPVQTFNGARYEFHFTAELTDAIKALVQQAAVTPNMLMLAAYNLLLYRYTKQQDILVGITFSSRNRIETEMVIGYFLTMLPIRTQLHDDLSFYELLQRVRETSIGAYANQDIPFGTLLDELEIARDPSRNPIYQVSFIYVDFQDEPAVLPNLDLKAIVLDNQTAKDDLMIGIFDRQNEHEPLWGFFEYNTDLFDEATIARMFGHLHTLLEAAVSDPTRRISTLPMLSEVEQQMLREQVQATAVDYPALRINQLIEAQVALTPTANAVSFDEQTLTYQELDQRASQLARFLQRKGVGPATLVGICMERSLDLVVGLLGILKAGAGYVPLDSHYPSDRLAYMINDSRMQLLLTQQVLVDGLPADGVEVVCIDTDWEMLAADDQPAVECGNPEDLAYVIYTSGSTGRPKGVQIEHRSVVNFLLALRQEIGLTPQDVLAAVTSISFDIAALEIYLPLITGAHVILVSSDTAREGKALASLLLGTGTTTMQATPATWQMLFESSWSNPTGIKLLVGGDSLSTDLAARMKKTGAPVWNLYGPTETTIWSTTYRIDQGDGSVRIGRPIANTQVYVLDNQMQPVPTGVAGELFIGGSGLARGYLNHPALTAAKFVPNPFMTHTHDVAGSLSDRLYKTGDLVRYKADGNLEFLGRLDYQVKLRGFRIELGDIESSLLEHPAVRQAVVVIREDQPGDKRLVAYIVPQTEQGSTGAEEAGSGDPLPLDVGDLRGFLQARLPEYMIPASYVLLESLPLTLNGKTDRSALPQPEGKRSIQRSYVAPRDRLEFELSKIWEETLGVRPIGITDRFFDLGGHSLMVVGLMARIEQQYGKTLPIASIFQGATVERFAAMLRNDLAGVDSGPVTPITPGGSKRPLFFIHPAGGTALCYVPLAALLGDDQPVYGVQAAPPLNGAAPFATYEERAVHYAQAIRAVQPTGPYQLAGWCYGGGVAFAIAQELKQQGEEISLLALMDSFVPVCVSAEDEPHPAEIIHSFAKNLEWDYTSRQKSIEELQLLSEDEHLEYLLELARHGNHVPADTGHQQMREALEMWKANLRLVWGYTAPQFAGRLSLIVPSEGGLQPLMDWSHLAMEGTDIYTTPGNHYTMMRPPHLTALAATLKELLESTAH